MWECNCDCGSVTVVRRYHLTSGRIKSCGCWNNEKRYTHGYSKHPLYKTYRQMMSRCLDPRHHAYKNYGGRGVSIHNAWQNPAAFIADIIEEIGNRPKGFCLDRIDNNKGYAPGNVRWATPSQQARNRRVNRWITIDGRKQCLADWALEVNLNPRTIAWRLNNGWSPRDAVYGR